MPGSKRRTKGEGSPEQLPSGLWRWNIVINGKKIHGPAAETKKEARELLNQKLRGKPNGPSFTDFARTWRQSKTGSQSTLDQWDILIETKIAADPIGDMALNTIGDNELSWWVKRQTQSAVTVRRNLGRLRQILKAGGNQARTDRPPDPGHDRRPVGQKQRSEIWTIYEQADEATRRGIILAWHGGLSRSEMCAAWHEDIEDGGIWVQRRAIATKGQLIIEPFTKTKQRRTWVPLTPLALKFAGKGKGFILTDSSEPLSPDALSKRFRKACAGTRFEKQKYFGLHALRRTFGMMHLENDVDVRTAAELMRHDPSMLLREYARSEMGLKRAATDRTFGKVKVPRRRKSS